tara:strand:+ start:328 stop:582 length:255 start_codon:yes stop_codon:yes gene_type:complete
MIKVTANEKIVEKCLFARGLGGVEVEYGTQGEMFIDVSLGLDKSMRLALADYVHESLIDMGKEPENSFGWRLQAVVFPEEDEDE